MDFALLTLGAIGHVILWVVVVNRTHALGIKRRWIDLITAICGVCLVMIPLGVAVLYAGYLDSSAVPALLWVAAWSYIAACSVLCVGAILQRCYFAWHPERRGIVLANHTAHFSPANKVSGPLARPGAVSWLARLPFNQALDIHVHEKQLEIPSLPSRHEGIRIAHLSDLHMSGRITKSYFQQVVEHVNRCEPDFVAITGDLVERELCFDWVRDTLGRLRAPTGVYYVLGNHDRPKFAATLHKVLADCGLIHLGGGWRQISVRGAPIIVAGNELPWHGHAPDLRDCPTQNDHGRLPRVLLSHSPDQFCWARQHDFDLMLAGHNHGGQVRLPVLGAILAPSFHGVRYAAGAFRAGSTVLHVSRGTSSLTPIRYNCPPEIALLVLRCAT
jgi:predicted MPP superfamily phosphohydrolase